MSVSQKSLTIYLILLNILILICGVAILSFEIFRLFKPNDSKVFADATYWASRTTFEIGLSIFLGLTNLVVGISGIVGNCKKHLPLITAFVSLATLDFIVRVFLCVVIVFACIKVRTSIGMAVKAAFPIYGNKTEKEAIQFTKAIATFEMQEKCCGWSVDEDENTYLGTVWYKIKNSELTATNSSQFTLPESCCPSTEQASVDSCVRTTSLPNARNDGKIHKANCLTQLIMTLRLTIFIIMGANAFLLLLDGISVYLSMMLTRTMSASMDDDSSDSMSETDEGEKKPGLQVSKVFSVKPSAKK